MGKKIKITEDQLKRIMSQNVNEQHEGEMEENMDITNVETDMVSELDRMTDSFIKQYKEKAGYNMDSTSIDSLCDKIREGLSGESSEGQEQLALPEPPSEEETQNNQVYESITQNFKRFL